jgi:predicted small lipoprotein YifL
MLKRAAAILVAACAALAAAGTAGCGQKGPLHVPGVPKDATWPYPEPPRKAAPAPRKPPDLPGTTDPAK